MYISFKNRPVLPKLEKEAFSGGSGMSLFLTWLRFLQWDRVRNAAESRTRDSWRLTDTYRRLRNNSLVPAHSRVERRHRFISSLKSYKEDGQTNETGFTVASAPVRPTPDVLAVVTLLATVGDTTSAVFYTVPTYMIVYHGLVCL